MGRCGGRNVAVEGTQSLPIRSENRKTFLSEVMEKPIVPMSSYLAFSLEWKSSLENCYLQEKMPLELRLDQVRFAFLSSFANTPQLIFLWTHRQIYLFHY